MDRPLRILILDDEPKMGKILARVLIREGHDAHSSVDPQEALGRLAHEPFDLLLTDMKMPGMSGMEVLDRAARIAPGIDVIMMTAYATVETAVEAMKKGAIDYLIKPFHNEELTLIVRRLGETRGLREENRELRETLARPLATPDVIAASSAMKEVLTRAQKVAATDVSVLLRGESGTGKEVLASLIHSGGPRREKAFVKVNCGALPETLLESELFGHTRGAFTGAVETRKGLFVTADGGTIFLDEVGEVSPALQVKLLRVLQSGEFQRVGDPQTFKVDVRVIAATNQPLERLIESGRFRSDFYYRLNVVPIVIPPLRDRQEDIPALIDHFLRRRRPAGVRARRLSPEAYRLMLEYAWPGNIRELENAIEHALVMAEDELIDAADLPVAIQASGAGGTSATSHLAGSPEYRNGEVDPPTLEEIEKRALLEALEATSYNHTRAAMKLGITRRTLGYRLDKYNLPRHGRPGRRAKSDHPAPSESPTPEGNA